MDDNATVQLQRAIVVAKEDFAAGGGPFDLSSALLFASCEPCASMAGRTEY